MLIFISTLTAEFIRNGDGAITDTDTKLQWQDAKIMPSSRADKAMKYCNNLILAGKNDWRLPTLKELETIVNGSYINRKAKFKFDNFYLWSSTEYDENTNQVFLIKFDNGKIRRFNKTAFVVGTSFRCVRTVK
jgi:hypothetical protein